MLNMIERRMLMKLLKELQESYQYCCILPSYQFETVAMEHWTRNLDDLFFHTGVHSFETVCLSNDHTIIMPREAKQVARLVFSWGSVNDKKQPRPLKDVYSPEGKEEMANIRQAYLDYLEELTGDPYDINEQEG